MNLTSLFLAFSLSMVGSTTSVKPSYAAPVQPVSTVSNSLQNPIIKANQSKNGWASCMAICMQKQGANKITGGCIYIPSEKGYRCYPKDAPTSPL